jgi:glucose-1-phosphate adenylyltransferase
MGNIETVEILRRTLVMLLAGGQGERLYPLTKDRAKPAVPFAGSYRLIDFTLSNCLNSGLRRIYVLTQYKSESLDRHIQLGWRIFNPEIGECIETRPPQQRMSADWYLGTADAIYQNIYTLEQLRPDHVLILSGDHVYGMDYSRMLRSHVDSAADLTIACIERPIDEAAGRLGCLSFDAGHRVTEFHEKPARPEPLAHKPGYTLCSMGVYAFRTEALVRSVCADMKRAGDHDFAKDVVPSMVESDYDVFAFPFTGHYWRDIGTLDAYWEANMDLVRVQPELNLYDDRWPFRGYVAPRPPAKIVFGGGAPDSPRAEVYNSLVCGGAIVSGAYVCDSVIGPDVRVEVGSRIEQSVIMDGTAIGRDVTIRKAIVDKLNVIPDGAAIGGDLERDRHRFSVSEGGVVVVPKNMPFPRG